MRAGNDRLINLREVMHKTSLGSTWIYQKMRAREFPQAIKLAERCVRWRESEIDAWIDQLQAKAS